MPLIGRKKEVAELERYYNQDNAVFIAVYGRRRIGKTFLVNEFFKNDFSFKVTGVSPAEYERKQLTHIQLANFNLALNHHSGKVFPAPSNWMEAFSQLTEYLETGKKKKRQVVFIDELPWMDTPYSGFLTAFEWFWNSWGSNCRNLMLIVCGSATSWIVNKIINSRGGLHNRLSGKIFLSPFDLKESEQFYESRGIIWDRYEQLQAYMVFGGVPYYLSLLHKEESLTQNIDRLFFSKDAILANEFENLFNALFDNSKDYIRTIEQLYKNKAGLTRNEIAQKLGVSSGGGLSKMIDNLDKCGFIEGISNGIKSKDKIYKLVDYYCLFYLNFVKNNDFHETHYWSKIANTPAHNSWCGFSFERICFSHLEQIKRCLGISGILTRTYAWRSHASKPAAQIDMLIDREDRVVDVCEMKFASAEYSITKAENEKLRNRIEAFRSESGTKKAIHLVMISPYGIHSNLYSGNVTNQVTMDALFE